MSPELLIAIALLCQTSSASTLYTPKDIQKAQLTCQKELIQCVSFRKKLESPAAALGRCIVEK
jgi:hypothetical protein